MVLEIFRLNEAMKNIVRIPYNRFVVRDACDIFQQEDRIYEKWKYSILFKANICFETELPTQSSN